MRRVVAGGGARQRPVAGGGQRRGALGKGRGAHAPRRLGAERLRRRAGREPLEDSGGAATRGRRVSSRQGLFGAVQQQQGGDGGVACGRQARRDGRRHSHRDAGDQLLGRGVVAGLKERGGAAQRQAWRRSAAACAGASSGTGSGRSRASRPRPAACARRRRAGRPSRRRPDAGWRGRTARRRAPACRPGSCRAPARR